MGICYYFGTFNPVHNGHVKIADEVKKQFGFEKVIFVPAFSPSHKNSDLALASERLDMLKLAVGEDNVSDIEYHLKTPSYTYQTIEHLGKCSFIIGYDAFFQIETWKNPEYLKEMLDFIVIPRQYCRGDLSEFADKGFRFKVLEIDFINISSEDIRKYIKDNLPVSEFVPKKVEEYLRANKIYRDS